MIEYKTLFGHIKRVLKHKYKTYQTSDFEVWREKENIKGKVATREMP